MYNSSCIFIKTSGKIILLGRDGVKEIDLKKFLRGTAGHVRVISDHGTEYLKEFSKKDEIPMKVF